MPRPIAFQRVEFGLQLDFLEFGHYVSSIPPNAKFDFLWTQRNETTAQIRQCLHFDKCYYGCRTRENEMDWSCSSQGGNKMYTNIFVGKPEKMLHQYVFR